MGRGGLRERQRDRHRVSLAYVSLGREVSWYTDQGLPH